MTPQKRLSNNTLNLQFSVVEAKTINSDAMEQTMTTLRKRVNELGVAEALVQQQGANRVVVELPGIQDVAAAKDIIGKTATLEFLLVNNKIEPTTMLIHMSVAIENHYKLMRLLINIL